MTETNLRNDFSSMSNTPMEIDNNKRPFQAVNDMSSETTTLNEPKLTQNDDGLFTPRGSTAVAAVAAPVITQEPEPAPPHNPTNTAYYYDTYYSTDDADTVNNEVLTQLQHSSKETRNLKDNLSTSTTGDPKEDTSQPRG